MGHRFPLPTSIVALVLTVVGLGAYGLGAQEMASRTLAGAGAVFAAGVVWWWTRHVARPHTSQAVITRRAELDQRSGGVATRLDIAEHASPTALRRRATVLRPSYDRLPWWRRRLVRWFLPPRRVGVEVARLGWGWWGEQIWSSCEDATLRIGGPRTGKTLSLACHGLDAPGALVTTSTRLDLAEMVHHARARRTGAGGVVHVFNPGQLGSLASTVRWRVLTGCADFTTAQRRAADLIPESTGDAERWDAQARRVLALLLHAAELDGRSMRDVLRWVADASPKARDEVIDALLPLGDVGRDRAAAVRAFWETNDRTRTSITTTMAVPLAWLSDDRARDLGDAPADDPALLDIPQVLTEGQTLHLIGHEDHTSLAPLIAALVAEIAHTARTLAGTRPRGRLDPPVTMLLDEAALVCPVPLDRWTADMGGRGVTLHISVQSLSQLRARWGVHGGDTILANTATFLVFGGSPTAADLRDLSLLTGEHRVRVVGAADRAVTLDEDYEMTGTPRHRWTPVLSPAQIRALEPGQVLVLRRGLPCALGWAPLVTQRRGWRQADLLDVVLTDAAARAVADLEDELARASTEDQAGRPDGTGAASAGGPGTSAGASRGGPGRWLRHVRRVIPRRPPRRPAGEITGPSTRGPGPAHTRGPGGTPTADPGEREGTSGHGDVKGRDETDGPPGRKGDRGTEGGHGAEGQGSAP
jgi:hypothetical protein